MARIYLQDVLDRKDAFRVIPQRAPRLCAACGDNGEFDDFCAAYGHEHQAALFAHFGGSCCTDCLDTFAECEGCHDVSDDVRSTTWGERLCPSCEDQAQTRRRF